MNESTQICVRINKDVKRQAEEIMHMLGLTPSTLIQMLYMQIIIKHGIPFDISLNVSLPEKPIATGNMSKEEITSLLEKSLESAKQKTYSTDEIHELLMKLGV